jgi:hypothetical protein
MKAHPQMLARAAPMQVKEVPKYLWILLKYPSVRTEISNELNKQVAEAPEYVVMRDNAGQLRLVNPRAIQGLEVY